ncbi:Membrane protein involved in the export of O-antigen and teichoic acid [Rhodococcus rhodochrous J3]|uniref:Membrane protein involved in the export of O-antigen and teichoic acid n=1 Tax=Rhodococcus rhodochrous J3 TaxID=903528 RepID=A0ABY1MAU3_RHORH|nr:Membrane protein involved in the export of O-antigen and teichoic acid [Rhodococcus rhodochrous J3]
MKGSRAYFAIMSAEAAGRAMAFVVGAAIARVYGLEVLAVVTLAQSLSAYVSVTSDGGLNNHALLRLFNRSRSGKVVAETSRAQVYIAGFVAPLMAVGVYVFSPEVLPVFLVFCLVPAITAFSTPYILQHRGRLGPIAVSRFVGALTTATVGILLIYVVKPPPVYLALPYVANAAAMFLVVYGTSHIDAKWYFERVRWTRLRKSMAVIKTLGLSALVKQVHLSAPLLIASHIGSQEEFEAMGVVYRVWVVLSLPAAMLATVLIPQIARNSKIRNSESRAFLALFCLSAGVCILTSIGPEFILSTLFGPAAGAYGNELRIFSLALLPLAAISVLSCRLIVERQYGTLVSSNIVGLFVLVLAYWVLRQGSASEPISIAWVISQISILLVLIFSLLRHGEGSYFDPSSPSRCLRLGQRGRRFDRKSDCRVGKG